MFRIVLPYPYPYTYPKPRNSSCVYYNGTLFPLLVRICNCFIVPSYFLFLLASSSKTRVAELSTYADFKPCWHLSNSSGLNRKLLRDNRTIRHNTHVKYELYNINIVRLSVQRGSLSLSLDHISIDSCMKFS